MLKLVRFLAAVAVSVSLAACGGVSSPSTQTTEDFSGTLDPASQTFKTFSANRTGELQVTLQTLTPRPVVGFVVLALGAPANGGCSLLRYIALQAAVGTPYSSYVDIKGTYCIILADANGILPSQVSWTMRVSHP